MDIQRAVEIIRSPAMVNVNYRGIPVYIKEVHSQQQTATVFPLDEMEHEQIVEINGLSEAGPSVHSSDSNI
jgi:small acid-soluble spore protein H (minor)